MNRSELQNEIDRKQRELEEARQRLESADRQCGHEWGEAVDAPIRHEGYRCSGDAPGTMGIDWRGPVYVPARIERRWKRVCKKCGKEEFTTRAQEKQVVVATPVW